jgi:hypothetical protein
MVLLFVVICLYFRTIVRQIFRRNLTFHAIPGVLQAVLKDPVHFGPDPDPTSEKTGSGSDLSYKIPLT